jgi:ATP synthase protein I
MAERDGSEDEERLLRARLDKLSGALDKRRNEAATRPGASEGGESSGKFGSAMGLGMRAASEFAAAVVIGSLIGWRLDVWLRTKPAFMIAFFMLGAGAGVWNVIRVTSPQPGGGAANDQPAAAPRADEDED